MPDNNLFRCLGEEVWDWNLLWPIRNSDPHLSCTATHVFDAFGGRRIRCSCVAKMENAFYPTAPRQAHRRGFDSLSQEQGERKAGKCCLLNQNVSDVILMTLRQLFECDSGNRGTTTISILTSLPALLSHLNRDSLCKERKLLQEIFEFIGAPDINSTVRSAAAYTVGALLCGDGYGVQVLFESRSLGNALSKLQKGLDAFWNIAESNDSESGIQLKFVFYAFESAIMGLILHKTTSYAGNDQDESADISFSRHQDEKMASAIPLIVDLVMNCSICHDRELHSLVSISFQIVDRLGAALGGNAITIVGDPAVKKCIYSTIVDSMNENDLLFASFFAVFYSVVNAEDLRNKLFDEVAPFVIPDLIARGKEDLIYRFASQCNASPEELVLREFPYVIAHLYLCRSDEAHYLPFESAVELAYKLGTVETTVDRSAIINNNAIETIEIVLWEICQYENEEDTRHGKELFRSLCELYCEEHISTEQPLAFIMRHQTLKHFYSRLMHRIFTDYFKVDCRLVSDQLQALKLVNYTIPLLGVFLDEHYAYLESILKSAQRIPPLQGYVCKVWSTLIRSLGPESLQLKANLSQIVLNLMNIGDSFPDLVTPTINFILIENGSQLKDEIKLVPSVDSGQPALRAASAILRSHLEHQSNFALLIERHLHGLECGHELVQYRALIELHQTLRKHRSNIANIFMGEEGACPSTAQYVRRVVCSLLRLCSVSRMDLRVKSSECLGEIGAIDPARIGILQQSVHDAFGTESDDEFVVEIIRDHLVRILRTAGSSGRAPTVAKNVQITLVERVHFSVQELLRILGCRAIESDVSSKAARVASFSQHPRNVLDTRKGANLASDQVDAVRGKSNWSRFPPEVQQIVKPFLAGHLVHTESSMPAIITKDNGICANSITYVRGMPLHRWACSFQRGLIARMKGSRSAVFQIVKPLLKHDTSLSLFLLPHSVFEIVCYGNEEDRSLVRDEMLYVLQETSSQEVEIDHGTILSQQGCIKFSIESNMNVTKQRQNFVGNNIQIGSESRRIIRMELGKHLVVDQPFPESLFQQNAVGQQYTICSPSRWNSASATASGEDFAQSCGGSSITQQVFGLIECFARWLEQAKSLGLKRMQGGNLGTSSSIPGTSTDEQKMANVSAFISDIPKRILAETSFKCGAYDRALLYLESSVRESWTSRLPPPLETRCDVETIKILQRIYVGLDDVDGLMGVAKLRGRSSLEEQVLDSERAGDWTAALACYEQASQEDPTVMKNHHGLLRCLRNLGHLQTMLTHAEGCMNSFPHEAAYFSESALQAAWRLGRWELIDELTKRKGAEANKKTFDFNLAMGLLEAKAGNKNEFIRNIREARLSILGPLAEAGIESYQRAYPFLVRLQMLTELQQIGEIIIQHGTDSACLEDGRAIAKTLIQDWDIRLHVTQPSLLGREPLLALRRVLFELLEMKDQVASGWLLFARAARCAGHTSTAQSAIMQADRYCASRAHIERAKLKWANIAERHESLHVLRDYLDRHRLSGCCDDEQVCSIF